MGAERHTDGLDDGYFDAYDRIRAGLRQLTEPDELASALDVPACPGWTVHSVIAHLAGLAADVVAEETKNYAEPAWTASHVDQRRHMPLDALFQEWDVAGSQLRSAPLPLIGRSLGSLGSLVFADAAVHEHDVRGALAKPDRRNESAVMGLRWSIDMLQRVLRRLQDAGTVPALRLTTTEGESWLLGSSAIQPVAVEADAFELWRGISGRRTPGQVAALAWSGDPTPFLPYWPIPPLRFASEPVAY